MMKKKFILGLAIGALLVLQSASAHALSLGFSPVNQTETFGNQVSIDLTISGLGSGAAPSLGTWDLDLTFDASVLSFSSVVFGDQLDLTGGGLGHTTIVDPSLAGVLDLMEMSLESIADLNNNQADSFVLATVTFDTVGVGDTNLNYDNVLLGDAYGTKLDPTLLGVGHVTVTAPPVPEPTTLLLFGTGMLGLIGYARRRKMNAR